MTGFFRFFRLAKIALVVTLSFAAGYVVTNRDTYFPAADTVVAEPAAHTMNTNEKEAIEQLVRDYLLKNPELMLEVQQALEVKQKHEASEKATIALANNQETIFNSKNQGLIGNPDGDVTVVEFFDYNCGYCQRAMNDMNALLSEDSKLKFIMKELPILSQGSVDAGRISTAIYRLSPEKYGEFHRELLSQQGPKDGNRALMIAAQLGLDIDTLQVEAAKDDVVDAFREVNDLATKLGINGTPSYVIGDEVVFGALGAEVLKEKISNMRKCGSTNCG